MSPILYCLHPDTELISLAFKIGEKPTECIFGEADMQAWADSIDWSDAFVVGHNLAGFDAMILAWRLGIKPRQWGCTLSMARPIHGKDVGGSLAALVKHYGLGVKDQAILHQTKGRHLAEFTAQERMDMKRYNSEDVEQMWRLFKKLLPHTPKEELALIDLTTRMLVNPQFDVDLSLLQRGLTAERTRKRRTLLALGQTLGVTGLDDDAIADQVSTILMSAPKFSALLTEQGVAVPTKISPTTGKEAPALAKTDQEFLDLQEHDNPLVAAAAMARLGTRSTILETRIATFIETAEACGGKLPVPLQYWGAITTGRWSGWAYNPQNLPRVNPSKPALTDVLRLSLQAPLGHQIVVVDLSGIELRMNHFLWKVPSSMALFQASPDKADLYKSFASTLYDVPPEEVTKAQRQIGKLCVVEGTLVLTERGEVPIEKVLCSDRVWDGVEWVHTLGPVYNGEQEVIYYDGITATPDHIVWVEGGRSLSLGTSSAQSLRLMRTGIGGTPLGFSGADVAHDSADRWPSARPDTVCELRGAAAYQLLQPTQWEEPGVPVVQPEVRSPEVAFEKDGGGQAALHQREGQGLPELWGQGGAVLLSECGSSGSMGNGEPGAAPGDGAGQSGQQWGVCPGKPAVHSAQGEHQQPEGLDHSAVSQLQGELPYREVRGQHPAQPVEQGTDGRGDCGEVGSPVVQTKRRVWDLLNCGPRHRFTANGKLISNCHLGLGYGAGPSTFRRIAKVMGGVEISEGDAIGIVGKWREEYQPIVQGWATCQGAVWAMASGREVAIDPWGLCRTGKECIHLPKGTLRYPNIRQEWSDKTQRQEWVYGTGRTKSKIYGGLCEENIVQALSRTVMADVMLAFAQTPLGQRYPLAHCVHDEVVYVVRDEDAEAVLAAVSQLMRTPPNWFPALITWSEGSYARRYGLAK